MAATGVRWRTRCFRVLVVWSLFLHVVYGYKETYTISQLSPKSVIDERLPEGVVLQTSLSENIGLSLQPSKFDDPDEIEPEDIIADEETEKHVIVARSADPNDRSSRSINIEEIPSSNNNEIDNDLEQHNKRKYYEILPTKTIDYLTDRDDEQLYMSSGFGDRLNFRFPGEANRVPKARALIPSGPQIHPTAVQPTFATVSPKEQGRQNTEIQNIITGIVKLLNGNVNVQANSQLLNGRPGRPMNSRINNRGPPRIENAPALPDFDKPITPPSHMYIPTKTPPPYPFDRPPHVGVSLPEQIVPPMNPYRPGFHRPMPPWQRPPNRPKLPHRRPNPGLPYKPTLPPAPLDLPDFEDDKPEEEEEVVSENETSHSENNLHHDDKDTVTLLNLPDIIGDDNKEEDKTTTTQEPTTSTSTTTTTTTTTTETTTTSEEPTTTTSTTTTEKPTEKTTETTTSTTEASTTEKPVKVEKEKKKETSSIEKVKEKQKISEEFNKNKEKVESKPLENVNETATEAIEPSMIETSSIPSIAAPTPTEGLISHAPTPMETATSNEVLKTSSINSQPLPSSQGLPYHPYRPRPGIVLDDPDFKPKGSRFRDREVPVITADAKPPGYGEIFDVTVSAIQGPGEHGGASVHIETVNLSGHGDHDDIIVSAAGDQGFVSIDGKRTYLNLFDTSAAPAPTAVQARPTHTAPPSLGTPIGTGVAIPADDIPLPPARRPPHTHHQSPHTNHQSPNTHQTVPRPGQHLHTHQPSFARPHPTVRIDTCIVGDDSTCDKAQNEKCRTEAGISSCQCRPGFARRTHRDPCRRVVSLVLNLRVDRLYDRKVVWDSKLADKESDPYQQMSYEAVRAIDSAFSMTPFSDDFVGGSVNCLHKLEPGNQVFINYTVLIQETPETVRPAVGADIHKHILGVIRRRSNNIGASALWVDTPNNAVLPLYDLDECASPELNDCHKLATCFNTWGAFKCTCPEWTLDAAANSPVAGRSCQVCPNSHCNDKGQCRYANSQPYCTCAAGHYGAACALDGEVVGVAAGASLAAAAVIALTLLALLSWSRKWSREQKPGLGSPVFSYMTANTVKTPPVGQPPYQVTLEERMRWAQIAEAMSQANHYGMEQHTMATRPSSAMFAAYPTLPPVPMPRLALHGAHGNGTLNSVGARANTAASHHNLYGYTNQLATESTSSEASSHAPDRADLLVPRPKSRARSMHNQTGIYYDVDYENAPEAIYGHHGTKGIPLSTYTMSRGPPYYRS